MITIPQARDVFLSAGFVETEAAGLFRWYEYPSHRYVSEHNLPVYLRALFYEPKSELQLWANDRFSGRRDVMTEYAFQGELRNVRELEDEIVRAIRARQSLAIRVLVNHHDERLEGAGGLVDAALSAPKGDRGVELVLADWLLDRGIAF